MTTFTYRSKGTTDDWTIDTIEAASLEDAQAKLDKIYGIERDDEGDQLTANVWVEIL